MGWPSLKLQRPLVAFDLETTGLDVKNDRIVELSCVKLLVSGSFETRTLRLNPEKPISASATLVHGITNQHVASAPTFAQVAADLRDFLRNCDLTGFNIERFDLPLLQAEFKRVGILFPEAPIYVIDSFKIFLTKEPRDLGAAYRFYCGQNLQKAHSAAADTEAAFAILLAQMSRYRDLPNTVEALHEYCHPMHPEWLDPEGKIIWQDAEPVLTFGKYRHQSLRHLAGSDPEYLRWVAQANFSQEVREIVSNALQGLFPPPPGVAEAA